MKVDLFTVPTHIGKVDLKKIKLKSKFDKAWLSKTPSSFKNKNNLDKEIKDSESDLTQDSVKTYLSEIGKNTLLKSDEERNLAMDLEDERISLSRARQDYGDDLVEKALGVISKPIPKKEF